MRGVILGGVLCLFVACGGSKGASPTPTTPTPQANRAPTINSLAATPSFGVADLQVFSFSAIATDPDGDALTYSWSIGGGTFTGASQQLTAQSPGGTYTAQLTVTDGRGGSVTGTTGVTAGSLSGAWSGTFGGNFPFRITLSQNSVGAATGNWSIPGTSFVGILDPAGANRIESTAHLVLRCKVTGGGGPFGLSDFTLDGQMQPNGNTMTGGTTGSGFGGQPFMLTK